MNMGNPSRATKLVAKNGQKNFKNEKYCEKNGCWGLKKDAKRFNQAKKIIEISQQTKNYSKKFGLLDIYLNK